MLIHFELKAKVYITALINDCCKYKYKRNKEYYYYPKLKGEK